MYVVDVRALACILDSGNFATHPPFWWVLYIHGLSTIYTLKKQNVKSAQEIVESPKFCMAILTICSNLIIFGLYQPYPRSFNLL